MYLVRHGRTEANAQGLLQGRLDPPLDAHGRVQAEAIAQYIGQVDEVIASPLQRAQETASYFGRSVATDDRWVELAYGEFEGVAASEVPAAVWERWRVDLDYSTEGGESFGTLNKRVVGACEELIQSLRQRRIVVVSHVSPIKSAVAWALGVPLDIMFRCHLSQASLCRIDVGRFGPLLHSFNEQAIAGVEDRTAFT